jgi:alpha-galactosidase/6-phospho-beta-glucosidase family protein
VTLIGAGSAVFARQLITDILALDGLDRGVFDEIWVAEKESLTAFD